MADFPANAEWIPNPNGYVDGPLRLTSVFPIKTATDGQILSGVQYEVDGCGLSFVEIDWANYDDCIRTAEKVFEEGLDFVESIGPWGQLQALKCRPGAIGGGTIEEFQARARRRLERLESAFLESKLQTYAIAEGTSVTTTGMSFYESYSEVLAHADDVNNPVLHIPYGHVVRLGNGRLTALAELGVTVVTSPLYQDDRIFLTGGLNIWATDTEVSSTPSLEDNYILAIAERQYILTIECPDQIFYATVPADAA